jgi:hypothetical protein
MRTKQLLLLRSHLQQNHVCIDDLVIQPLRLCQGIEVLAYELSPFVRYKKHLGLLPGDRHIGTEQVMKGERGEAEGRETLCVFN